VAILKLLFCFIFERAISLDFVSRVRLESCKKENPGSLIVFFAIAKFIQYTTKTIKLPSRKILTGYFWTFVKKLPKIL